MLPELFPSFLGQVESKKKEVIPHRDPAIRDLLHTEMIPSGSWFSPNREDTAPQEMQTLAWPGWEWLQSHFVLPLLHGHQIPASIQAGGWAGALAHPSKAVPTSPCSILLSHPLIFCHNEILFLMAPPKMFLPKE